MRLRADQNATDGALSWQDIAKLAHERDFRLVAPDLRPSDPAVRGLFTRRRLRSGLTVHMSDALDLHDLTTRIVGEPGITVTLFLGGRAAISVGGRRYEVGARRDAAGRESPMAVVYATREPDIFERRGIRGQHVRKVGIRIPPGWLEDAGLDTAGASLARRLAGDHGGLLSLPVSPGLARLARCMLADARDGDACCGLIREARAFEMLARVFQSAAGEPPAATRPAHAEARLRAARQYMSAHIEQDLTLADVARHACVSVSTLQRLFRDRLGMPVSDYLRRMRLEEARLFLERGAGSVTEAALRAGYSSPANFATAFRREYGISPSCCRREEGRERSASA